MILSFLGLAVSLPVLIPAVAAIWLQDQHSPFYIAPRVGRGGKVFNMVKLRSMIVRADQAGVDSTSSADRRITPVGQFIRRTKLDELPQLWNVLKGDMSLVGPRPNVPREVALYTAEEQKLLSVRPGITDIASIVFADEGEILKDSPDPDLSYHQLIRPWKNRLGLLYVERHSLALDFRLIFLTVKAVFSRKETLADLENMLADLTSDEFLKQMASRRAELIPFPPPGAAEIVRSRNSGALTQGKVPCH